MRDVLSDAEFAALTNAVQTFESQLPAANTLGKWLWSDETLRESAEVRALLSSAMFKVAQRADAATESADRAVIVAVAAVVGAVLDEGPNPPYHRVQLAECRRRAPVLFDALDNLVLRYALAHWGAPDSSEFVRAMVRVALADRDRAGQ